MKLEFIKPGGRTKIDKPIVRVSKKGTMTLNPAAGKKIEADNFQYAAIARDPEHPDGSRLYLATYREPNDFSVKVSSNRSSYLMTVRSILKQMEIPFEEKKIEYAITEATEYEGNPLYVLERVVFEDRG